MAKELQWFKFFTGEYIGGKITLEDLETQGLFINICAHYWHKSCVLSYDEIRRRFPMAKQSSFDALIKAELIHVSQSEMIKIKFLFEQLGKRNALSSINSKNGQKGGRKNKPQDAHEIREVEAVALNSLSEINPTLRQQEKNKNKNKIKRERRDDSHEINSKKNSSFIVPNFEEIKLYFLEKKSSEKQAQRFFDFYESKDWFVGKNKMKKWKAAASQFFESREKEIISKPDINSEITWNQ